MVTFFASVILLFAGYAIYSKVVERSFGIDDDRKTPAYTVNDGMDFVPMSWWKGWLIQLLNIAGLGPKNNANNMTPIIRYAEIGNLVFILPVPPKMCETLVVLYARYIAVINIRQTLAKCNILQ